MKNVKERTTPAGKALTEKRVQLGLSQQKLSNILGIDLRVYQRLETGETDFRETKMKYGLALCALLDINPYILVFGQEFAVGDAFRALSPEDQNHPESEP